MVQRSQREFNGQNRSGSVCTSTLSRVLTSYHGVHVGLCQADA